MLACARRAVVYMCVWGASSTEGLDTAPEGRVAELAPLSGGRKFERKAKFAGNSGWRAPPKGSCRGCEDGRRGGALCGKWWEGHRAARFANPSILDQVTCAVDPEWRAWRRKPFRRFDSFLGGLLPLSPSLRPRRSEAHPCPYLGGLLRGHALGVVGPARARRAGMPWSGLHRPALSGIIICEWHAWSTLTTAPPTFNPSVRRSCVSAPRSIRRYGRATAPHRARAARLCPLLARPPLP